MAARMTTRSFIRAIKRVHSRILARFDVFLGRHPDLTTIYANPLENPPSRWNSYTVSIDFEQKQKSLMCHQHLRTVNAPETIEILRFPIQKPKALKKKVHSRKGIPIQKPRIQNKNIKVPTGRRWLRTINQKNGEILATLIHIQKPPIWRDFSGFFLEFVFF